MTALLPCGFAVCRAQLPLDGSSRISGRRASGERFDTSPGTVVSRGSVARQCARSGTALRGTGRAFVLDDEVALRFFPLQQMTEGSIELSVGEADPLKGPTDVGTADVRDEDVALSSLIDRLNERFGTDFAEADQLFFDQIRASAENNENIAEAARANSFKDFASYLDRMLDELFIARMEGNEEIFSKVMTDPEFRLAAHEHLANAIFRRVREKQGVD